MPQQKLTVTVFGAGITGLTAAHELVIRGFDVTVIEKELNTCVRTSTLDRGVGGIARSQFFCHVDSHDPPLPGGTLSGQNQDRLINIQGLHPVSKYMFDDTLALAPGTINPVRPTDAAEFFAKLHALHGHAAYKICFHRKADGSVDALVAQRKDYVRTQLGMAAPVFNGLVLTKTLDDDTDPPELLDWVIVTPSLKLFPGEHGFRFFPSFYRHLFDTMRRTPVTNPHPSERNIRTVFDNLVPVDELGFARGEKKTSFALPRKPVLSFELVRRYLREITRELEYTLEDMSRFEVALFEYMTSCSARREAEYENLSWSDFIDVPQFSAVFRDHLEYGPQMALGLRGSLSDARTQGNVVTQMFRDQIISSQNCDSTLDGPTSSAWFNHWKDYLLLQGVKFERGTLIGFRGQGQQIIPQVTFGAPMVELDSDYYVLAFALQEMNPLVDAFLVAWNNSAVPVPADNDFARVRTFCGPNLTNDLLQPRPNGPLQHLAGIQYYFDTELKFWRAHTQYLDSPWSLSSISQPQFWARARDITDNFRSLVSVDIGDWERNYAVTPPAGPTTHHNAWSESADRIAKLAWAQIRDHHDEAFYAKYGDKARFPRPIAYALDQRLDCSAPQKIDYGAYLVAKTGMYRTRPGALSDGIVQPKAQSSYGLVAGYVLAGTYMQTFTRLTSMEAANESARHAVNAILDDAEVACDRCEIWDNEELEFDDLTWFKELDKSLFDRGLPHFVRTLGWRSLPDVIPFDLIQLGLTAAGVL
jgi:hypothetical protein